MRFWWIPVTQIFIFRRFVVHIIQLRTNINFCVSKAKKKCFSYHEVSGQERKKPFCLAGSCARVKRAPWRFVKSPYQSIFCFSLCHFFKRKQTKSKHVKNSVVWTEHSIHVLYQIWTQAIHGLKKSQPELGWRSNQTSQSRLQTYKLTVMFREFLTLFISPLVYLIHFFFDFTASKLYNYKKFLGFT